jgi:hypothetical protein
VVFSGYEGRFYLQAKKYKKMGLVGGGGRQILSGRINIGQKTSQFSQVHRPAPKLQDQLFNGKMECKLLKYEMYAD